jgi:hypothetical protein
MDWISTIAGTRWGSKPDPIQKQPLDEMLAEAHRITEASEENDNA